MVKTIDMALVQEFDGFVRRILSGLRARKKAAGGVFALIGLVWGIAEYITGRTGMSALIAFLVFSVILNMFLLFYIYENVYLSRINASLDPNFQFTNKETTYIILGNGKYKMEVRLRGYPRADRYKTHTHRFHWTGDRSKTRIVDVIGDKDDVTATLDDADRRYTHIHLHFAKEKSYGEEFNFGFVVEVCDDDGKLSAQHFSQRTDRYLMRKSKVRVIFPNNCKGSRVIYRRHVGSMHAATVEQKYLDITDYDEQGRGVYVERVLDDKRSIHVIDYGELGVILNNA